MSSIKKYPFRHLMIALLLHLSFFLASAQKLPAILTATRYEKGVYKNFSEFLRNSPSITSDFRIKRIATLVKIDSGLADYKLIMLDSAVRRRDAKKFWGACDGESIYVNEMSYNGHFTLRQMHGLGRYCYFYGSSPTRYLPVATGGGLITGAVVAATGVFAPYVLNVNNGKFFLLDREMLRIILKQDQELLTRYEAAEKNRKDEVRLEYIKEYNSRHESEAAIEVLDPIEIIFYRREKKEPNNPVTLNLGDSTQLKINSYDFRRYFSTRARLSFCINDECDEIPLAKKRVNYIECIMNKKRDRFELIAADPKKGEFDSKKIEAGILKDTE